MCCVHLLTESHRLAQSKFASVHWYTHYRYSKASPSPLDLIPFFLSYSPGLTVSGCQHWAVPPGHPVLSGLQAAASQRSPSSPGPEARPYQVSTRRFLHTGTVNSFFLSHTLAPFYCWPYYAAFISTADSYLLFSEPWTISPRPTTCSWSNPTCAPCRILIIRSVRRQLIGCSPFVFKIQLISYRCWNWNGSDFLLGVSCIDKSQMWRIVILCISLVMWQRGWHTIVTPVSYYLTDVKFLFFTFMNYYWYLIFQPTWSFCLIFNWHEI